MVFKIYVHKVSEETYYMISLKRDTPLTQFLLIEDSFKTLRPFYSGCLKCKVGPTIL